MGTQDNLDAVDLAKREVDSLQGRTESLIAELERRVRPTLVVARHLVETPHRLRESLSRHPGLFVAIVGGLVGGGVLFKIFPRNKHDNKHEMKHPGIRALLEAGHRAVSHFEARREPQVVLSAFFTGALLGAALVATATVFAMVLRGRTPA